ncbi:MAG: Hsp20/alpha crystallin family protein [Spirochaetota bacterium]|nr:Hsp20/alpha crystallin family protein [Spirochaetota bacterium]
MLATLFHEMDLLNRSFDSLFNGIGNRFHGGDFPLTNVVEKNDEYEVYSLLPGIDPNEVDITFENGVLSITGEKKCDTDENKKCIRNERSYGNFNKQLKIKAPVDTESIKASYKDGVLKVVFKKSEQAKPIKIKLD